MRQRGPAPGSARGQQPPPGCRSALRGGGKTAEDAHTARSAPKTQKRHGSQPCTTCARMLHSRSRVAILMARHRNSPATARAGVISAHRVCVRARHAPSGTAPRILASISGPSSAVMSDAMKPGATALTVMLRAEYSRATDFVRPITPAWRAEAKRDTSQAAAQSNAAPVRHALQPPQRRALADA